MSGMGLTAVSSPKLLRFPGRPWLGILVAQGFDQAVDTVLPNLIGKAAAVGRDQAHPVHDYVIHLPLRIVLVHGIVDIDGRRATRQLDFAPHLYIVVALLEPRRLDL